MLPGEGETKTMVRTRRECGNCGEPATKRHAYLWPNARRNPASRGYRRDDISYCSDAERFTCDGCTEYDVLHDNMEWCSTFSMGERFAHLFLYWASSE